MPKLVSNVVDVYAYRVAAEGSEFLVLRRSAETVLGGTWQAVHGRIEEGETALAAAVRELSEETRLGSGHWHQLESVNTFYMARSDEIHLCAGFAVRIAVGAEVVLNAEHDGFKWLRRSAAQERLHWPAQRRAVDEICTLIVPGGRTADSLRVLPT